MQAASRPGGQGRRAEGACDIWAVEFCQDNPPGHSSPVEMFKENLSLCKRCYYVKRASLNNMGVSDLVNHLSENPDFGEKSLGQAPNIPNP